MGRSFISSFIPGWHPGGVPLLATVSRAAVNVVCRRCQVPICNVWGFPFPHILINTCYFPLAGRGAVLGRGGVSLWFHLHGPEDCWP